MIDYDFYQKQLDDSNIPVDIKEFEKESESTIKVIVGALLLFAPNKVN